MKRRRQEESIKNPFPVYIWYLILDYAIQFECRLASKTTVDGDLFLVKQQLFVVRENLCIRWPQEDVSFDVSTKVKYKSEVWWSKKELQLEYWNQDGTLQDSCPCAEKPFENRCSKYPCFETKDLRICFVDGRFYNMSSFQAAQFWVTSRHFVIQTSTSLIFVSLGNPQEKIEIPCDFTRHFIVGDHSGFVAYNRYGGLDYVKENMTHILLRNHFINTVIPIVDNTFIIVVYFTNHHRKIVLCHVPTGTETLIMKDRHVHVGAQFVGNEFLLVASWDIIRVFQWEESAFRYTGCITGAVTREYPHTWKEVFFATQGKLCLICKDHGESVLRIYQ
jgi:hypothetical protein